MTDDLDAPDRMTHDAVTLGETALAKAARRLRWLLPLFGASLTAFTLLDRLGLGDPARGSRAALAATAGTGLVLLAAAFLCVTVSAIWLQTASALLAARGQAMRHSPTGAWAWYFLPIANLIMPLRALREIWTASLGHGERATDPLLVRWWSAWIVGNLAMSLAGPVDTIAGPIAGTVFDAVGVAALLVAGMCFARIVATVTRAQAGQPQAITFA